MNITAELWPVRIATFRHAQDDVDGLVDIAQTFDYLAEGTEGGLPVGDGDAGIGSGRRHAPVMVIPGSTGF